MTSKDIGGTVRAIRRSLGMTSTTLAARIGLSQPMVSRSERGLQGFRSDVVVKLAAALRVLPFRLFMTDAEWNRWLRRK